LSLSQVRAHGHHVSYDSTNGNAFKVEKGDMVRLFQQSPKGLYFFDTKISNDACVFVSTVENNRSNYTACDYSCALLAWKLQQNIGRPSTKTFLRIISDNLLPNCPITTQDVMNAAQILGPDVGSLEGKTVRRGPIPVSGNLVSIPAELMQMYRDVTLSGDIMFVNRIAFFVTKSRKIHFSIAELLRDQKNSTILKAIRQVKNTYRSRGFKITSLLMDNQFESLRGDIADLGITLNVVSNDEHVPDIERHIRMLKERTRCVYNDLLFQRMPARLIIEMVYYANFWLNNFPAADGISNTLSPRSNVLGTKIDYNKHCRLPFGAYAQVHEDHDNSMDTRTTGAIAMRPTGNDQGGYYFFSLTSGLRPNRNNWTVLPMPADVID
jgi:hypothetical protein